MDRIQTALKGTAGCRVEIKIPETGKARASAQRLAHIFRSCGYPTVTKVSNEIARDGVFIEASQRCAAAALTIQSAFHAAKYDATVAIHELSQQDVVVIHIGPAGID